MVSYANNEFSITYHCNVARFKVLTAFKVHMHHLTTYLHSWYTTLDSYFVFALFKQEKLKDWSHKHICFSFGKVVPPKVSKWWFTRVCTWLVPLLR